MIGKAWSYAKKLYSWFNEETTTVSLGYYTFLKYFFILTIIWFLTSCQGYQPPGEDLWKVL